MSRIIPVLLCFAFLFSLGCKDSKSTPAAGPQASATAGQVAPQLVASQLTVLIVDDASLAAGLKLLRGEWAERTGGQLVLEQMTLQELTTKLQFTPELKTAAPKLKADLIIYPSRYLGSLVAKNWLRPVRKSVLQSEDVAINEMFPLIRDTVLPYGGEIYALTLGEPPLMLAGSAEPSSAILLSTETLATWQNEKLRPNTEKSPLKYPLAVELLIRGTALGQYRGQWPSWFDSSSMQAKIASPPFVRALEQMQAGPFSHKVAAGNEQAPMGASRQAFLSWPAAERETSTTLVNFAPLPVAEEVYNPLLKKWEANKSPESLVCLGFAGRSVSVARSTRNSSSAFKLMHWITSENIVLQISPRSKATTWFRKSQVSKAKKWLPRGGLGNETVHLVTQQLSAPQALLLPRIPGIDAYLESLNKAVRQALTEDLPAEAVLAQAAQQWDALTEKWGRDRQGVAYRMHLGLAISNE